MRKFNIRKSFLVGRDTGEIDLLQYVDGTSFWGKPPLVMSNLRVYSNVTNLKTRLKSKI